VPSISEFLVSVVMEKDTRPVDFLPIEFRPDKIEVVAARVAAVVVVLALLGISNSKSASAV
jgi:hypothetical protein